MLNKCVYRKCIVVVSRNVSVRLEEHFYDKNTYKGKGLLEKSLKCYKKSYRLTTGLLTLKVTQSSTYRSIYLNIFANIRRIQ